MSKEQFYSGKEVAIVEWWVGWPSKPDDPRWARLRVFTDGTADACLSGGRALYGFENRTFASCFLGEDEFCPFAMWNVGDECFVTTWDADDERCYGVRADARIPQWTNEMQQGFEYLGAY